MNWNLRLTAQLLAQVHADLDRPHPVAFERVGFLVCRIARGKEDASLLAADYLPMADEFYLPSAEMGAVINADGIRTAMQMAFRERCSLVHVHRHEHEGSPGFSDIDRSENAKLIPSFWHVVPDMPHGALVLSFDRARGRVWDCDDRIDREIASICAVGTRIQELV